MIDLYLLTVCAVVVVLVTLLMVKVFGLVTDEEDDA